MATYSSILAWRIPWTEEPGALQSIGSQRVGHNKSDLAHTYVVGERTSEGIKRRIEAGGHGLRGRRQWRGAKAKSERKGREGGGSSIKIKMKVLLDTSLKKIHKWPIHT